MLRELDRVADQIEQHLAQPSWIAYQRRRYLGGDVTDQFQSLLLGTRSQHLGCLLDEEPQVKVGLLQFQSSCLDPGEVQDVVDDRHQRVGRGLEYTQVFVLFLRQHSVQHQISHTHDAVYGCADLVAHAGQELTLRPVGCLGGLFGFAQRLLRPFAHQSTDKDLPHHLEQSDFRFAPGFLGPFRTEAEKPDQRPAIDHWHHDD